MLARPEASELAVETPRASDTLPPTAMDSRWGALALSLGFLAFGVAIGGLTGLSSAQGISLTLLSALFTFVSGVVLTFAGFRRVASRDASLDPARVGAGLGALSVGIVLGLVLGVYGRCNVRAQSLLLGEHVEHSQCSSGLSLLAVADSTRTVGAALMAQKSDACQQALFKLEYALRDSESERSALLALMSKLNDACLITKE